MTMYANQLIGFYMMWHWSLMAGIKLKYFEKSGNVHLVYVYNNMLQNNNRVFLSSHQGFEFLLDFSILYENVAQPIFFLS